MIIELTLPVPPTSNTIYATQGRRRIKSKEAKAWEKQAMILLHPIHQKYKDIYVRNLRIRLDNLRPQSGCVQLSKVRRKYRDLEYIVTRDFYFPDDAIRDTSNFTKLLDDTIVRQNLMLDDSFIIQETNYKHIDRSNPRVEYTIDDRGYDWDKNKS